MSTWYEFKAKANANETEVLLYNEIGGFGVSAAAFLAELQQVPAAHRLILRIHSPGGSVLDGNAIVNAIRNHPGGVTTHIDGLAASMATVVAIAGAPVKMAGNALFMVHNVSAGARGDSADLRRMADLTDKIQETIVAQYVGKTGLAREKVLELMEAETWMTAKEAKSYGFIDEITGNLDMAANAATSFDLSGFRNAAAALARIDKTPVLMTEPILSADEQTLVKRFLAFFTAKPSEPVVETVETVKAQLASAHVEAVNRVRAELIAAHVIELDAKDAEIVAVKAQILSPEDLEAKIASEVTNRLAAAGADPILRDPAAVQANQMDRTAFNALSPSEQRAFCLKGGRIVDVAA